MAKYIYKMAVRHYMYMTINNFKISGTKKIIVALILIVVLGFGLRFYKLGMAPPSISWDEAAVGYNAWTILHWGKDEWGRTLPLVFKSFEDYKHPLHVYLTVPFIAIFGPTDFGVRAPSAFFGVANIIVVFFLVRQMFKKDYLALVTALVLAISPYNIDFSRFNHELNFVIFFFMAGLYCFFRGLEKKNWLLPLGFAFLGLDLLGYHSAKIIVPAVLVLLLLLYFRKLIQIRRLFAVGIISFSFFAALLFIEPQLLGTARIEQTSSSQDRNVQVIVTKYLSHFSSTFLFTNGDTNPRLSSQTGMFYPIDAPFLIIGLLGCIWLIVKNRQKESLVVLAWALLAPIPASFSSEFPHAGRAMFMTGSWHIIIAFGIIAAISQWKDKYLAIGMVLFAVIMYGQDSTRYLRNYYLEYSDRYAIDWQYGMSQVADFVSKHPEYYRVYMTNIRQQPYIFFLFYQHVPLPLFLSSVQYDESIAKSYNTVMSFDRYQFGGWSVIESYPDPNVLYVIQPIDYDGLRYRGMFEVVDLVKYPNGTDAFYLVSGKK